MPLQLKRNVVEKKWIDKEIRRQAIIWTVTDAIHWRIYAALGGDELNPLIGVRILMRDLSHLG